MKEKLRYMIILLLTTSALIAINLIPKITPKAYREINDYIAKVEKNNSFKYYSLAEAKINALSDEHLKRKLQTRLGQYSAQVYTQDIRDALYWFGELWAKKDLWPYEVLRTYVIGNVKSEEDREYLYEQLEGYGKSYVYTPSLLKALSSIDKAWKDKSYIKEAEQNIINPLSVENPWTMAYLEGQLNMIKAKDKEKQQILIIGDSITLGIGADYLDKKPITKVQDTWWNSYDSSKYQFSTLAIGGIGVLRSGMVSALELVKFVESNSKSPKEYDKVIIALSTNDVYYSKEEYKKALMELVDYVKANYTLKQLVFINFNHFEDTMEEVAKSYGGAFIDIDMKEIHKCDSKIDDIHPSSKGQKQIYEIIKSKSII